MGRYAPTLSVAFADVAGVRAGARVLDVGCGPGGLTRELVARAGAANVAAVDPAEQFAQACRARYPGADVREGVTEALPWSDGEFDATLASLVIAFMRDPDQGVQGDAAGHSCGWDRRRVHVGYRGWRNDDAQAVLERRAPGGAGRRG